MNSWSMADSALHSCQQIRLHSEYESNIPLWGGLFLSFLSPLIKLHSHSSLVHNFVPQLIPHFESAADTNSALHRGLCVYPVYTKPQEHLCIKSVCSAVVYGKSDSVGLDKWPLGQTGSEIFLTFSFAAVTAATRGLNIKEVIWSANLNESYCGTPENTQGLASFIIIKLFYYWFFFTSKPKF